MARGWESKAVADQMEQTEAVARPAGGAQEISPEERARRDRVESLRLTRALTLAQMERPITRAHRDMLQRRLLALETEIESLTGEVKTKAQAG